MRFTSTPRGVRLTRRLVSNRLDEWGYPYGCALNESVTLIAAELVADAVRHGHVPGRDFHLRLTESPQVLRLEVSDTRTERLPKLRVPQDESGRGLLLVEALADRSDVSQRRPGKCVWAEVRLSPATAGDALGPSVSATRRNPGVSLRLGQHLSSTTRTRQQRPAG